MGYLKIAHCILGTAYLYVRQPILLLYLTYTFLNQKRYPFTDRVLQSPADPSQYSNLQHAPYPSRFSHLTKAPPCASYGLTDNVDKLCVIKCPISHADLVSNIDETASRKANNKLALLEEVDRSKELTLKGPITTAADDIHKYFFFIVFQRK